MITKTSAEAQNQFGQLLDTVQREPVVITRHGRVAAVVVSPRDMEELEAARKARRSKIAADWETWRKKAKKGMKPAAKELTDEEVVRLVHELR
ncbi:MAG: type II toxin-antitoxin system Phd/YefM family antitoxin [Terracidiphilus sp.]